MFDQEQFEDKDEFYSKIENLNIQIYESDNDENNLDEEERKNNSVKETDSETGRADDPVRMYLKEMGNVELLSRSGEIEIAKRIEHGKKRLKMPSQKVLFPCNLSLNILNNIKMKKDN